MYIPVRTESAVHTARAIYNRWYPIFGIPSVFRMDGAPGFTSLVLSAFARIIGVKHLDISAPDNPTHHSVVERRNEVMDMYKILDVAQSKGDLNNADDLEMYCAAATATCNIEPTYNGHTVLEYLTGEVPRTQNDLVTKQKVNEIISTLDDPFLNQLQRLLSESNSMVQYARDDEARYNAIVRDANQDRRITTRFTLHDIVDDEVSYEGERYKLIDLVRSTPTQPTKAIIRSVTHEGVDTKTVLYSTLRPLASPRPVHMHTELHMHTGDFIFFSQQGQQEVHAGVITSIIDHGQKFRVHEHRQVPRLYTSVLELN